MYIKQVIIHGFKSYRDQIILESFDPGHNVVVGRNGSGKSNFFYSIQFVLGNEFYPLRLEQRQSLLHEGIGPRIMTAYVEIIFNNTDGRLPIDTDVVYLRREIGLKTDNYYLNKRNVSRTDVMKLLESAGFSTLHPYYIVKQGEINQMATAQDAQRLKLLREVAGTRVYDERKIQSETILRETKGKLEKITDFLKTMDTRLEALEEEKEELKEYQRWDKQRRCLEYTIYDRELKENKHKLTEAREVRTNSSVSQAKLGLEVKRVQDKIHDAAGKSTKMKKDVQSATEELESLSSEQQQLFEERTKLSLTINDLTDELNSDMESEKRGKDELEQFKRMIDKKNEELNAIKLEYEREKLLEEELARPLSAKEQKRKELYIKEGRGVQFNSKEDRDKWIENELQQLTKAINDKEDHRSKLVEDLERVENKKIHLRKKIEECQNEMETQRASIGRYNQQYREKNEAKNLCQATKKEKYRHESALQLNLSGLKDDLARANRKLRSRVGKQILNGRDSVRKVLEKFRESPDMSRNIESYRGQVIENFDCDDIYHTAIEVTAGTRLFNHIVETDEFGTKILKEMNIQRLPGEVTFMPLNRLHVKIPDYPDNATPMISCLKFDPKYKPALMYIFGRTLICPDLSSATDLAQTSGIDCVTLDGDQVSCKGSLTGGYFSNLKSRLEIQKTITQLTPEISALEDQWTTLKNDITTIDQDINVYVSEMHRIETKISKARNICDKMKAEIVIMNEELDSAELYLTATRESLALCVSSLSTMNETKGGLEVELGQDLVDQLSDTDKEKIVTLTNEIRTLVEKHKSAFSRKMKCETEKNKLESLLTNNLLRHRDELIQKLRELSLEDRQRQLDSCKIQLVTVEKSLTNINNDIKIQREKLTNASREQKSVTSRLQALKFKEKEAQENIEANAKDLQTLATRENRLEELIAEYTNKISELGAMARPEAYERVSRMSSKQIFRKIEKANNHLKQHNCVNKKALDQFMTLSDQKERFSQRKEELDRANKKIIELMTVLEHRKYEAIQFTFKEVSKNFADIFKKLVPCGHGQLVMKRAREEIDDDESPNVNCDRFAGVGIRVSFNGQTAAMREMNQLSGGQKSLVALTLIFAIQKCDPAPFYLFDEIDQALDAEHRKTVAKMIHELSSKAQFITTTFKPELLQHANKFYGVKFANQVSHIECVTQEEAAEFVTDGATDQ